MGGGNLPEQIMIVRAFSPATVAAADPDWICCKDLDSLEVVVVGKNATTVVGSAVTLRQATAVAGTSNAALGFTTYYATTDPANTALGTKTTAASNTFTTTNTNSLEFVYRIPVDLSTLDVANSRDCVRVELANATNTTIAAYYVARPKYSGNAAVMPNIIAD